ncbi:glycine cleavage system aminomethyltransferase GcvT [Clostridium sp. P21]|uniref:Aminomethyltransferase n=1 Tax=Clostridium muellerianum TaxID=2716538 RepID=A0A7Y0HRW8_9CLOT|nr:glycine cleavage system aminomethyltransferase GcvT [Clostridium muellerianum]NMM65283.1 glycine cleavage system aminomethyltransferase GcvT [Clostridium muellerianum]
MGELKKTPLFNVYPRYGGKIIDFAGWALPVQYQGIIVEHEAVRNAAGIFDVSHMGEVEIKGKDAFKFVQNLITNDASILEDNQALYTPMCYEHGGTVDDILVYKYADDYFYLVINAGNIDKDFKWMIDNKGNFDVSIENISPNICEFAIQGPKAQKILQKIVNVDLSDIKFFYCKRNVKVNNIDCMISRTGYTGEDGFEVFCSDKDGENIWVKLLEIGKEDGLIPVGLGCRDTLRFEVCLPLYGNELAEDISPLEAGIGFFVKLNKDKFIGKEALLKQKSKGLKRKLIGFEMKDRGIPRHGYKVQIEGQEIGYVTTGYKSPSLNKNIGLALIKAEYANLGKEIEIVIRNKSAKAEIIDKKFYKKNYKK